MRKVKFIGEVILYIRVVVAFTPVFRVPLNYARSSITCTMKSIKTDPAPIKLKSILASSLAALVFSIDSSQSYLNPHFLTAEAATATQDASVRSDLKELLGDTKYETKVMSKEIASSKSSSDVQSKALSNAEKPKVAAKPISKPSPKYASNKSSPVVKPQSSIKKDPEAAKKALEAAKEKASAEAKAAKIAADEKAKRDAELGKLKESINSARMNIPIGPKTASDLQLKKSFTSTSGIQGTKEAQELDKIRKSRAGNAIAMRSLDSKVKESKNSLATIISNIKSDEKSIISVTRKLSKSKTRSDAIELEAQISTLNTKLNDLRASEKRLSQEVKTQEALLRGKQKEATSLEKKEKQLSKIVTEKQASRIKAEAEADAQRAAKEREAKSRAIAETKERMVKKKAAEAKDAQNQLKAAKLEMQAKERALKEKQQSTLKAQNEAAKKLAKEKQELARLEAKRMSGEKIKAEAASREADLMSKLEAAEASKAKIDSTTSKELAEAESKARAAINAAQSAEQRLKQLSKQ